MPAQVRLPRDLEEGGSERTAVAAGLLKGSPSTNGTVERRADGTLEGGAVNGSYGKHYGSVVPVVQEEALAQTGTPFPVALKATEGGVEDTPLISAATGGAPAPRRKFFASWFTPSFVIVALVVLNGDSARGALFPTLWPLVSSLGGDRIMQGYVVSAFSFGRLIASPFIGRLSEVYGYRLILTATSVILMLGTLLYASATTIWHVLAAQIVMGVGSGTLGVTRAYVAEQTARQKRTVLLAYLTAVQYAGFTVMPLVGGILEDSFGRTVIPLVGPLRADHFTSPALFMGCMSAVAVLLLLTVFKEHTPEEAASRAAAEVKQAKASTRATPTPTSTAATTAAPSSTRANMVIIGGILLNVATKGSIAIYETLGIQFATTHFTLTAADAGFIFAGFGLLGVIALLYMKRLCQLFTDVELILGGMALMIACNLLLLGPDTFPIWRFYVAIFLMYATGYPVGHTAVIGMFSKVLGKRPQGYLMGWFGSAGSLARVLFPILGGHVAENLGNNALFVMEAALLLVSGTLLFLARAEVLHMSEFDH